MGAMKEQETTFLDSTKTAKLQKYLLAWFEANRREYPWRETRDPYAVLVAEKLLQQTAVGDRVVKAYEAILALYPSPLSLANAELEHLEEIVFPLGLHYRARELKTLASVLIERCEGVIPDNIGELKALPGVGEYTARAVLSFAYGEDVPVVDTNVARFLYRVFRLDGPVPANPARKKSLIALAGKLLPQGHSKEFNLAILDLCALICTPSNPECNTCPVYSLCEFGSSR